MPVVSFWRESLQTKTLATACASLNGPLYLFMLISSSAHTLAAVAENQAYVASIPSCFSRLIVP